MNLYDIKVKTKDANEISLSKYKGKVLLIVNTATHCGYTPQYTGLQYLYEKYKENNFEILDFPCNQFGNQAPGSSDEIYEFCTTRFNIQFEQFEKIDVNGENESPLFTFLKTQKGGIFGDNIKWNFTKFLIDKNGNVINRYAPMIKPENIESDIEKLL